MLDEPGATARYGKAILDDVADYQLVTRGKQFAGE
jgi:hypothetical protein